MAELKHTGINQCSTSPRSKADSSSILKRLTKSRLFAPLVAGVIALTSSLALADSKPIKDVPTAGDVDGAKKTEGPKDKGEKPLLVADAKPMDKETKTQDTGRPADQRDAKPGTEVAKTVKDAVTALDSELANLPTVPLADVKRLVEETYEKYQKPWGFEAIEGSKAFTNPVRVEKEGVVVLAGILICRVQDCDIPEKVLWIEVTDAKTGEYIAGNRANLAKLERLYKKAHGKNLDYTGVDVEIFKTDDSARGIGIAIEAIPVERLGGEIESNTPMASLIFFTGAKNITKDAEYRRTE